MHSLILPHAGPKGNTIIKAINNSLNRFQPDNKKQESPHIQVKDLVQSPRLKIKQKDQHKHDLVYYGKCPEPTCNDCLGESGRRIIERSADYCGKDKQSHLPRHALDNKHKTVDLKDFKILTLVTITIGSRGKSQKPCILKNKTIFEHTRSISTIETF